MLTTIVNQSVWTQSGRSHEYIIFCAHTIARTPLPPEILAMPLSRDNQLHGTSLHLLSSNQMLYQRRPPLLASRQFQHRNTRKAEDDEVCAKSRDFSICILNLSARKGFQTGFLGNKETTKLRTHLLLHLFVLHLFGYCFALPSLCKCFCFYTCYVQILH